MKILLLGKNGQVGWELQRALAPLGEVIACDRSQADLENLAGLRQRVQRVAPQIIVNAAAYTAVDKAESEPERAQSINHHAVALLAEESLALNAWLIHYSTDYVFDGAHSGFYRETDATAPQSVYGASKLAGEQAIRDSGCRYLIFRTSWVYARQGHNFAKTLLKLARERDELRVVCDQIGAPTGAELIADVTAFCLYRRMNDHALAASVSSAYHLVAGGETSWHGYAQWLLSEAARYGMDLRVTVGQIQAISTAEYPLAAKRPANSRLDTQKLRTTFDLTLPDWRLPVSRLVAELTQSGLL
jgi:dTDP-4-dehydrorhamnose reductase